MVRRRDTLTLCREAIRPSKTVELRFVVVNGQGQVASMEAPHRE
jgi:hypothetical protein